MTEQPTQQELVTQELKGRIGQVVSQYEEQLANIKAEAITLLNQKDQEVASLKSELEALKNSSTVE